MQSSTRSVHRLAVLSLVAFQLSCGDSSGPGNVATSMSANSATTVNASPGAAVPERPSVVLQDQAGAPVSGVTVTFVATGGGGSVTGGTQVTNSQGIATVGGWTTGTTAGPNTLVASSGNLAPITFTANTLDPCLSITPIDFGTSANASLTTTDCRFPDGSYIDFFSTTLPAAGTYVFSQSSTTFDTFLALFGGTGNLLAVQDDIAPNNTNSALKAILPAGNVRLGATSYDVNVTGSYTIASAASTAGITNCEEVYVATGASTSQELQSTDCLTASNARSDDYLIFLEAGQSITVTMSSGTIDCLIELYSTPTTRVAFNDGPSNAATMTFTSTSRNFYLIRATSVATGALGAYTLVVQ